YQRDLIFQDVVAWFHEKREDLANTVAQIRINPALLNQSSEEVQWARRIVRYLTKKLPKTVLESLPKVEQDLLEEVARWSITPPKYVYESLPPLSPWNQIRSLIPGFAPKTPTPRKILVPNVNLASDD